MNWLRFCLVLAFALPAGPATAGPFEDALAAYQRGDYKTAAKLFQPLAEQGYPAAQFNLAVMYRNGRGVRRDDAKAFKLYRRVAEQGDAAAQFNIGLMYDAGQGVRQDSVRALRWYRKAARQGIADAQVNLGVAYLKGEGISRNYVRAHMWSSLAARQGHEGARKYRHMIAKRMSAAQLSQAATAGARVGRQTYKKTT